MLKRLLLLYLLPMSLSCQEQVADVPDANFTVNGEKPRVIVMTDGEVDDRCSMVHFLLCSSDFQVDAIIESNSVFQKHGWSSLDWLENELDDYAKVYPNLIIHHPDYPTPDYLRSVCFVGDEDESHLPPINPSSVQPGEAPLIDPSLWPDTPGSDRIVEVLLEDDPRTVYLQAWGGSNTAARAFYKLKTQYPADYERAVSKVVMYNIWYQDGAGSYIETEHPLVTMLLSYNFSGTWDYASLRYTEGFVNTYLRGDYGPLAKHYVQDYLSEGDSPSFFHFIHSGLRSYEHPTYGGWGGQFHLQEGFERVYVDNGKPSYFAWTEYVNRDFEARLRWCVADSYEKANHKPVITVNGPLDKSVRSGETVVLEADAVDNDPVDIEGLWAQYGPAMSQGGTTKEAFAEMAVRMVSRPVTSWWQYGEAGTYPEYVKLQVDRGKVSFVAPKVSKPETIHIIFEAKDRGTPALTNFTRFVITVNP